MNGVFKVTFHLLINILLESSAELCASLLFIWTTYGHLQTSCKMNMKCVSQSCLGKYAHIIAENIHGYKWITQGIHGYPLKSLTLSEQLDIHGYLSTTDLSMDRPAFH